MNPPDLAGMALTDGCSPVRIGGLLTSSSIGGLGGTASNEAREDSARQDLHARLYGQKPGTGAAAEHRGALEKTTEAEHQSRSEEQEQQQNGACMQQQRAE